MELLKLLTCGSVDDGKSTLIGHMLYSAKLIFADQRRALEVESRVSAVNGGVDYSLLLDGLEDEREQGITIDVAYRFFSTDKRRFIVADTPGHSEYTRNMAVGASYADLALVLVDVRRGILTQTKRHVRICALMGIKNFVFAVNKMDLVGYEMGRFSEVSNQIEGLIDEISKEFNFETESLEIIPVSATEGDNLIEKSEFMPWYNGKALLTYLEAVSVSRNYEEDEFCMPVQRVSRPDSSFRGYQGEVVGGTVSVGDEIVVYPSGEGSEITRIISAGRDTNQAAEGEAVTLCLDREVDVSRGSVLASSEKNLHTGRFFAAYVLWLDDSPIEAGTNRLRIQIGTSEVYANVKNIRYLIDIDTGHWKEASRLSRNDLALCEIETGIQVTFDEFKVTRALGGFILTDPVSDSTAACGVVAWPIGEEGRTYAQKLSITREMREKMKGHKAMTLWLTGLSGSGKSTIADSVEKSLFNSGIHTIILDGDNIRNGLCKGLGFSPEDRAENLRRVAETAKLLNDAGTFVICAFISPMKSDRKLAKNIIGPESFIEVYVEASTDECIRRDTKGLYLKAIRGEIREFTGISSPYEAPADAELTINTEKWSVEECRDEVMRLVRDKMLLQ